MKALQVEDLLTEQEFNEIISQTEKSWQAFKNKNHWLKADINNDGN
ncbi:hypothetical protein QA601_11230 [Chitinispirillales bacterium ANBcel5]|nr:hypothetical protein [Chitinispirillales bacterium ANBcel5]